MTSYSIVVPTIGRESLRTLLDSLERNGGLNAERIVLVDDRANAAAPLNLDGIQSRLRDRIEVVRSGGRGPAAARNVGWRATQSQWVCFLDDDVVVSETWADDCKKDLSLAEDRVGGVQGRITVPSDPQRPRSDWERNVGALARSAWITADMAYRRTALEAAGGFDERFTRAYREDSDLAIRIQTAGYVLAYGARSSLHPVRPADRWISVRLQRGNADDVLMRALHGPNWRDLAQSPPGRFRLHAATVLAAGIAVAGSLAWAALTADFAWRRIAPGPKTRDEIVTMVTTSAAIPFAAVYHRLSGYARVRAMLRKKAA
ncbi:MAG: glycosyltransferase [Candidatus Eremiobacteraeota bacterium]|nr:glycosyltransferase [Candidatus Eremiobacteraeota bacterium]